MRRQTIRKLLVANRGEIASRVMRTARRMGIETVAVYSDADENARFVRDADEAVRIGPAPSRESYLVIDKILSAAKMTGADAIHPGFGFLAENAELAEAVADAGMTFVGPSPEAIRSMGDKRRAKGIAREAGVPVIEGYDGEDQADAVLIDKASALGFPVLVKASAGGGGKGMRIVRAAGELGAAIETARREAERSFGDGTLLIERYLERPRHIEIQILGDSHGELVYLFERECSIQRRHQKVIEEAPSPAIDETLRQKMGAAAVEIGKRIEYTSAGTVEMILDQSGDFFFLEVNTRLQVEHPVTEMILGLDLVEQQIRVARGEKLSFDQAEVLSLAHGHAIECRLYAEDPAAGFLPQTGHVEHFEVPEADGVRVDSGIETGSDVGIHYDPMLAKIITWGATRHDALQKMRWTLARIRIDGVVTNRALLAAVMSHPAFVDGNVTTHFLDEELSALLPAPLGDDELGRAASIYALFAQAHRRTVLPTIRSGFRNNRFTDQRTAFVHGQRSVVVDYRDLGAGRFAVRVTIDDQEPSEGTWRRFSADDSTIDVEAPDGHRFRASVLARADSGRVAWGARSVELEVSPRFPDRSSESAADGAVAPMPGQVIKVLVEVGAEVSAGQPVAILEAMKMEHTIEAPHGGTVTEVHVAVNDQVDQGSVLITVSNDDAESLESEQ